MWKILEDVNIEWLCLCLDSESRETHKKKEK
jgi:hypothetical protein